ncbi:hypothetical protein P691DRAFT_620790, partial [Macrolepiota fuliginosa MF-IS2]
IGHKYYGNYYGTNVPSERTACPCEEVIQTYGHILRACPKYEDHCHLLQAVSDTLYLPDILGAKDRIATLAGFLEKSGAFPKTGKGPPERRKPTMEDVP